MLCTHVVQELQLSRVLSFPPCILNLQHARPYCQNQTFRSAPLLGVLEPSISSLPHKLKAEMQVRTMYCI